MRRCSEQGEGNGGGRVNLPNVENTHTSFETFGTFENVVYIHLVYMRWQSYVSDMHTSTRSRGRGWQSKSTNNHCHKCFHFTTGDSKI